MSEKVVTILKILVVILFIIALGMGVWLVYNRFIKKDGGDGGIIPSGKVNLVWWVLWEDAENLQVIADAYTALNPGVTITIEKQELKDLYKEKALSQISDGVDTTGPDILRIHNTWLTKFQNNLSPMPTSVMQASEYNSTFFDTAATDFTSSSGQIYAIPLMFDGLGVYYNKTLLGQKGYTVPEDTWDDFLTQAKALTQYKSDGSIKIAGAALGSENNIDFSFEIISLLMLQEGSTMVDASGQTTFGTDPEKRAAKALKYYTDYVNRYEIWDRGLDRDIQMFAEGRLAMMIAPSWRVHDINAALKQYDATLDYDIAPVPQQPTVTGEGINWSDYWAEAVSAESKNADVAWDFLAFASTQEQLRNFYQKCSESRDFGEIYPRVDMKEELVSQKYVGAYAKMASTARTWKMVDKEAVSAEFDALVKTLLLNNVTSIDSIQTRLQSTAQAVDQVMQQ